MALQIGDVVDGKYRIVRQIGKGGMGAVYEGENVRIKRRVAIKVLHAGFTEDETVVRRFQQEAQAAGQIGSSHIVEVLDLGDLPGGDQFMVMEFLAGDSLKERMAKGIAWGDLLQIMLQLLEGLAAAHDAGIVHRDLKPANIFLIKLKKIEGDYVKILDFGVSKFQSAEADNGMTQTGMVVGTPHYMAPEQIRGKGIDHRADLFAVGLIMYRALCGRMPFKTDNVPELIFKIVMEDAPRLEERVPNIDPELARIVHKALAREADDRYETARHFAADIEHFLMSHGISPLSVSAPSMSTSGAGFTPAPGSHPSWGGGSSGPHWTPAPTPISGVTAAFPSSPSGVGLTPLSAPSLSTTSPSAGVGSAPPSSTGMSAVLGTSSPPHLSTSQSDAVAVGTGGAPASSGARKVAMAAFALAIVGLGGVLAVVALGPPSNTEEVEPAAAAKASPEPEEARPSTDADDAAADAAPTPSTSASAELAAEPSASSSTKADDPPPTPPRVVRRPKPKARPRPTPRPRNVQPTAKGRTFRTDL